MEEEEDDYLSNVPHTDLPDVILVEEDEHTEKIDNEATSENKNSLDQPQAAEKDNQVNEKMLKRIPETIQTNTRTETIETRPDSPRIASQEYTQPQVEVINAGDARKSENCPESLFVTSEVSSGEEGRPRARVAFADPTLRSNPSTPVRAAVSEASAPVRASEVRAGPSEEEMTLASLGPEEMSSDVTAPIPVIETSDKVTEPPKEAPTTSSQSEAKEPGEENQLPTLGNKFEILSYLFSKFYAESDPVFHEIEQTVKAKPQEAKAVNSIYIFIIKQNGKPVKRWRKSYHNDYHHQSYLESVPSSRPPRHPRVHGLQRSS